MDEYLQILSDVREFTQSLPYIGGRYRDKRTLKQKIQDTNISSLDHRRCLNYHQLILNIIEELETSLIQKELSYIRILALSFELELNELMGKL